jgi:serine/threonine-protein kinase RsbW
VEGGVVARDKDRSGGDARGRRILRLKVQSSRDAIAPAVEHLVEQVGDAVCERSRREDLAVALSEALSNAVRHGHRNLPQARVLVAASIEPNEGVVVDVRDFGPGFDTAQAGDCPGVLAPGGRGIFLMHQLMDEVVFNARGNRVRLVICCEGKGKRFGSGDLRGLQSRPAPR